MSGAVLVTGATGVVGSALLPQLEGRDVLCLQHREGIPPRPGVEVVVGDITRPRLGLDAAAYAALADRVEVVVHSAAITDFTEARETVFAVNVDGTANVLALARDAGARHLQVSTAFVTVHNETEAGWVSARHYLDSKRAGEELVLAADDAHVLRPSVVIGDSATGVAAHFQGYHQMVRSVLRETMPIFVVDEDTRLDFVPSDVVAAVLAAAVDAPPPGRETWVTAGADAWLVKDVVAVLLDVAERAGRPVAAPRLVSTDMYERLVKPVFLEELPKRTRKRFEKVQALSPTILVPHTLDSSLAALGAHYGRSFAFDAEAALRASASFLLDQTPAKARA